MLIGIFVLGLTGWFVLPLFKKLTNSLYDRTGLEKVTTEQFGDVRIADVLTEDVMIVTYDFIGQKPVIFTKYAAKRDPIMNQYIRDAAQASSAAPIYFDPKSIPNISEALIDGGVIANSPSFYSYLHAKYTLGK
jgi:patatin-like phospholipase/acyl hydrolase